MINATDTVTVYLTLNREMARTEDAATMAAAMGVDLETLGAILEGDQEWEPEESVIAALADTADVESEEWDVSEIVEG